MAGKLLPLLLVLVGLGGGVGAGLVLRPEPDTADHGSDAGSPPDGEAGHDPSAEDPRGAEYVKMNNQFVVPVVEGGRVSAMVVLSLSVEVTTGNAEAVYRREPKLRAVFLQVMFDHANVGGFSGSFTDGANLVVLRTGLKEAAVMVLGGSVRDVLITDFARQDS